ncbi:dioxygenase [Caulobacter sp. SSI4214]|uniref:dioxygenase family protein n=1 Tax=Caulobacter sp. SSI4214 TaxID=2575739 RepID=UPI00143BB319|nr:dioxygenase [Caulobacter sp. SSI4214]
MSFATEENITDIATARWATCHDPRLRELMTTLVKHAHAFIREVEPTHEEWLAATEYLAAVGQISDEKRKEFILLSDVLGISMLVVMQNGRKPSGATPDTVLGPFHIEESPILEQGADMAGELPGEPVYLSGTVRDHDGNPVAGAELDIWQADQEGAYEAQIPDCGPRLRALQYTDSEGRYGFWTIAPKGYAIPMDGPVGALISQTDISYFRPAHIHFLLTAPGFQPVVTHLFREGAEYIDNDVVFGAKRELVVPFRAQPAGTVISGQKIERDFLTVDYDFVLVRAQNLVEESLPADVAG